jgi:hypothetical protein
MIFLMLALGDTLTWNRGLDGALHQDKPVLLVQLLGNWDDEFC